jgi:multisubunit Na+/H+ antiporter MnhC subunit
MSVITGVATGVGRRPRELPLAATGAVGTSSESELYRTRKLKPAAASDMADAVSKRAQDAISRFDHECIRSEGTSMPIESAIVVTAIIVAFVGFALVLQWAEHQTRDMHPH